MNNYAGKLADPHFRTERARKAGAARTGTAYHLRKLRESLVADGVRRFTGDMTLNEIAALVERSQRRRAA